jgi:hypothetical protein
VVVVVLGGWVAGDPKLTLHGLLVESLASVAANFEKD